MGQSHDFWRAYSLFLARSGANDATRGSNKLYSRQKSRDYHYYQYTRPIRTNVFHKEDCLNMKSLCGLQIPFTAQPFSADKLGYLMTQIVQPFYRYCKSTHLFYSIDKGLFLGNSLDLHCTSLIARNKISFNGCALNY